MVKFDVSGLQRLRRDMEAAGTIPDAVLKEMVTAQAEVVEKALVKNATDMLQGPYFKGDTAKSVHKWKARMYRNGPQVRIQFKGMQHRNRNAEVAFVNEYGKKSQPARPFIKKSIKETLTPAADEARKILNDYISSKNL